MSEINYLTTKDVARLCHVSDATVKRWEDAGVLRSQRTSGKHRRFLAEEVARFQREQGLGARGTLGDRSLQTSISRRRSVADNNSPLLDLLTSGSDEETANYLIGTMLKGTALTSVFDEHLSPVLRQIGELWYGGELSVAQEHLASRAAHYAAHKIRDSIQVPEPTGKTAFCAALEGDLHELPPYLAQISIENEGWEVMNFGANLPLFTLTDEITQYTPDAVCISATFIVEIDRLTRDYKQFHKTAQELKIPIILGGRMFSDDDVRRRFPADFYADSFASVVDFINRLV